ncbi:MAG: dihydrofolate reductase family protein [Calditrichia bacterium]
MAIKCSVYIATSVDGFIAREDGDIEWLHRPEFSDADTLGLSYEKFISTVDMLVMGRNTFEKVLTFSKWPYNHVPVMVLSTGQVEIPELLVGKVRVASGSPVDLVKMLEHEGKSHLYIDGGITIQRFLRAGLIHEIVLTVIPILLGKGIRLFGNETMEWPLELINLSQSRSGMVQMHYKVKTGH